MYYAILTVIALVFAYVTWTDLRRGMFLLLFALPTYLLRLQVGPLPSTLLELLVLIFLALAFFKHRIRPTLPASKTFRLALALLIVAATIGIFVSPDHRAALGVYKAYFIEPILFFLVAIQLLDETSTQKALRALSWSALFVSLAGIAQYLTGLGFPVPWDVERRVTSIYPFPNAVGLFLAPIIVANVVALYFSFVIPSL